MPRTHGDSWDPHSPIGDDHGPDTTGRAVLPWQKGSERADAFRQPGGPAPPHLRRFGFQPLVVVVRVNQVEHSRQIAAGALLQVHPSSGLKRFSYQFSLFNCQFFGFGLVTWIHSTHEAKP
ncbi:MAG: hypothetical protein ACYS5V_02000 [Planctomycetota bacterium]